jgi:hypothetical protein
MLMDMIDAAWARQIARIRQQLGTLSKTRTERRDLLYREQPDVWQARGHATGARHKSLSELDGDRE